MRSYAIVCDCMRLYAIVCDAVIAASDGAAGKLMLLWTGPTGSLNQFDTLGKDPLPAWITTQNH